MRKSIVSTLIAIGIITFVSIAAAEANESKTNHFGAQLDVGVPDGIAFGVVVKPKWYWLQTNLSATHNVLAPGVRVGIKLDPIKFPIRLSFTGELGYSFEGSMSRIETHTPRINYTYVNLHPGLEIGSNNGFSFFLHAGPTWMNIQSSDAQSSFRPGDSSVSISNPHANVWLIPSAKFGFTYLFL